MMGTARLRGSLDIYNIFNANSVLSMTPTYGPSMAVRRAGFESTVVENRRTASTSRRSLELGEA